MQASCLRSTAARSLCYRHQRHSHRRCQQSWALLPTSASPSGCWCCYHHHHHHASVATRAAPTSSSNTGAAPPPDATTTTQHDQSHTTYIAPSEAHLQHLAAALAAVRQPGDVYCLYGAVGAGKSTFSRAYIRAAAEDPQLPVPSPTYLLQIIYDEQKGPPIHHFDLYRLEQPQQQPQHQPTHNQQQQQLDNQQHIQQQQQQEQSLARLNLAHSFSSAVSLIEWPERLPHSMVPRRRLEVHIDTLAGTGNNGSSGDGDSDGGQVQQHQEQQQHVIPLPPQDSQQSAAAAAEEDVEDVCESESESDPFADTRWRRVQLRAYGEGWQHRLQQLGQLLVGPQQG